MLYEVITDQWVIEYLQGTIESAIGGVANGMIDQVAPGRPCTHKPMREILACIREDESVVVDA